MKRKIGNSWGVGKVIHDPSGTEIMRGWGGGVSSEEPSMGGYGYVLESHNTAALKILLLFMAGCLFGFWLRNALLVKVLGNPISNDMVFNSLDV